LPLIFIVCILNGMTSPFILLLLAVAPAWVPSAALGNLGFLLYLSSLACATLTLLLAGIPAALYERWRGQSHSDPVSLRIWLAAALLLSLPGLLTLVSGKSGLT